MDFLEFVPTSFKEQNAFNIRASTPPLVGSSTANLFAIHLKAFTCRETRHKDIVVAFGAARTSDGLVRSMLDQPFLTLVVSN